MVANAAQFYFSMRQNAGATNLLVTDGMFTLSPNKGFVWSMSILLQVIRSALRPLNSATGSRTAGGSRGRIFRGDKPLEVASGNAALK